MSMMSMWVLNGGKQRQGKHISRWTSEKQIAERSRKREAIARIKQKFLEGDDFEEYLDID